MSNWHCCVYILESEANLFLSVYFYLVFSPFLVFVSRTAAPRLRCYLSKAKNVERLALIRAGI